MDLPEILHCILVVPRSLYSMSRENAAIAFDNNFLLGLISTCQAQYECGPTNIY